MVNGDGGRKFKKRPLSEMRLELGPQAYVVVVKT